MTEGYTVIPHNMSDISPYVSVNEGEIVANILQKEKCYFYDTCSFRIHSNLGKDEVEYLLKYIKSQTFSNLFYKILFTFFAPFLNNPF